MKNAVVSIVTVVFNDKSIEDTIKSVLPFISEKVEYVIVDGGSKDGTLEIINKYADKIDVIVSEPDKGIYDAMNKAAALAHGRFIYHLNSGDFLLNLPVEELDSMPENTAAAAYPLYVDTNFTRFPSYNWRMKYKSAIHHQGTFYKRELVKYDLKYRTFADLDLNQRIYNLKLKVITHKSPFIANHRSGGVSSNGSQRKEYYSLLYRKSGLAYVFIAALESFLYRLRILK